MALAVDDGPLIGPVTETRDVMEPNGVDMLEVAPKEAAFDEAASDEAIADEAVVGKVVLMTGTDDDPEEANDKPELVKLVKPVESAEPDESVVELDNRVNVTPLLEPAELVTVIA
jgi:hypothetical protein